MKRNASSCGSDPGTTFTAKSAYFKKLDRQFYDQPSLELSQALLGKVLVRKLPGGEVVRGTIVETEAYTGEHDPASHTYRGKKTERNAAMFMEPGTAYVYFTYGMYHCFNISSQENGAAVLLRGIEPLDDYSIMHQNRNQPRAKKTNTNTSTSSTNANANRSSNSGEKKSPKKPLKMYELANGPGKICLAFQICRSTCDKLDLCTSDVIWLEQHDEPKFHPGNFTIEQSTRVGIDSTPKEARDQLWRFFIQDNFAVSTAKPSQIRKKLLSQLETGSSSAIGR